jgi:hypothetical protein
VFINSLVTSVQMLAKVGNGKNDKKSNEKGVRTH